MVLPQIEFLNMNQMKMSYIPEVEDIYRLSDLYLFLAESDTAAIEVPLSVLEAMACNLPVICTPFGGLLRRLSIDELPQLINVLRGEMAVVGPRPVTLAELDCYYGAAAAHYLTVRPGITGLWQVSGRSETSYDQRVALDVAYVSQPSLIADMRILIKTPVAVLSRRGAH